MSTATSLALSQQHVATAYYRFAARPAVLGPADEHERLWAQHYEARSAVAEGNPAFAGYLLPVTGDTLPSTGNGLPLRPTGVRYVVNEADQTVTVTLDVAGPVGIQVLSPQSGIPYPVTPAYTATRATATFRASADGLYALTLTVGTTVLTTVYVPVMRAEWRRFREQVRAAGYVFTANWQRLPKLPQAARARLARLIAARAAAQASDLDLFARLSASLAALPEAPSPVALFPRHG